MSIEAELSRLHGKNVAPLKDIAKRHIPDPAAIRELLSIAKGDRDALRPAATKLLKLWCEEGLVFNRHQSSGLVGLLREDIPWESRLHILQMLPAFSISDDLASRLHRLLLEHLTHANKFIRAWAYNGLAVLAVRFPRYRQATDQILKMGMRDEVAAVKSRIRNIMAASDTADRPTSLRYRNRSIKKS
jgi:hypothetical protein